MALVLVHEPAFAVEATRSVFLALNEGEPIAGGYSLEQYGHSDVFARRAWIDGPEGRFEIVFMPRDDTLPYFVQTEHCNIMFTGSGPDELVQTPDGLEEALFALRDEAQRMELRCGNQIGSAVHGSRGLGLRAIAQPLSPAMCVALLILFAVVTLVINHPGTPPSAKDASFWVGIGLVSFAAFLVRLQGASWPFCESASIQRIQIAASPIWALLSWEVADYRHPPVTSLLLHGVLALRQDEFALRLPFIAASSASLVPVGMVARRLGGPLVALGTCIICATVAALVSFGQEIGSHALFLLAAPVVVHARILLSEKPTGRRAAWLAVLLIVSLWTHYFSVILFVVLCLDFARLTRRWTRNGPHDSARETETKLLGWALAGGAIAGAPAVLGAVRGVWEDARWQMVAADAPDAVWGANTIGSVLTNAADSASPPVFWTIIALAAMATTVVTMQSFHRSGVRGQWFAVVVFAWLIPCVVLLATPFQRMQGRYALLSFPFLAMMAMMAPAATARYVSHRLSARSSERARRTTTTVLSLALAGCTIVLTLHYSKPLVSQKRTSGRCAADTKDLVLYVESTDIHRLAVVHGFTQGLLGFYSSARTVPLSETLVDPTHWRYGHLHIHALTDMENLGEDWRPDAEERIARLVAQHDRIYLVDAGTVEPAWPELEHAGGCQIQRQFGATRLLLCEHRSDIRPNLVALGYVEPDPLPTGADENGLVYLVPERAQPGYQMIGCSLMDMQGNVLHSWADAYHCALSDSGDVLMFRKHEHLVRKVGSDGSLIWERTIPVHHEVAQGLDGATLIASKEVQEYNGRRVEFDVVIELGAEGAELSRWSTWDHFLALKELHRRQQLDTPGILIPPLRDGQGNLSPFGGDHDYYHLNGIQVLLDTPLGKTDSRFQPGNLLLSFNFVNLLVILDRDTRDIVWSWGPEEVVGVHTARMTPEGTIVLFDNGHEMTRPWSRVVEIDPPSGEIVWEFDGGEDRRFFSQSMGSAQRLVNGNTLVGVSSRGRAFEVTPEGEVVWEWQHPSYEPGKTRGVFYRIERYPLELIDSLAASHPLP